MNKDLIGRRDTPKIVGEIMRSDVNITGPERTTLLESDETINLKGSGKESIVIQDPRDENKVIAYVHQNESPLRDINSLQGPLIYHTHRLWSTLFPHNFPKIHTAANGPDGRTVRSKVNDEGQNNDVLYPIERVFELCEQYNVEKPVIDPLYVNFMTADDGGEYYVDLIIGFNNFDIENLTKLMNKLELTDIEIRKVLISVQRLKEIKAAQNILSMLKDGPVTEDEIVIEFKKLDLNNDPDAIKRIKNTVELLTKDNT